MQLQRFFSPRSVAIIGVSDDPKKVGHITAKNMLAQGFGNELYFINPKEVVVLGKRTYSDIKNIGKHIDLAIVAVPAELATKYLDTLYEIGCTNVLIFAAGFGETNTKDGHQLEAQLIKKAKKYKINLLGPNCIGFVNTKSMLNATFFKSIPEKGNISIVSQSGALGSAMLDYFAAKTRIGLSHFISLGNKSVIDESDCLEYMISDKNTEVVGLYLEDVKNGKRFGEILTKVCKVKPVIILKSGITQEGSQAAQSHTGSMIGNDKVFDAVIRDAGAIRAESFAEFQMLMYLYSLKAVPSNRNVLVLSNAGGMGVLLTDALVKNDLHLVTVSESTINKLKLAFDETKKISVHNPIDLLGDASAFDYHKAIELTMNEKDIGSIIILLTPQANTQIMNTATVLQKIFIKSKIRSLYPIFMGKKSVTGAHMFFEKNGIASFRYFAALPQALSKILSAEEIKKNRAFSNNVRINNLILISHLFDVQTLLLENHNKNFLNQYDSLKILEWCGIQVANFFHATSISDLDNVIKEIDFPMVAKISSDSITHKTEVKGVITGITLKEELEIAYKSLENLGGKGAGCLVQKEYEGHELIIGAKKDCAFKTVVMVGLGGVYAELLDETIQFEPNINYQVFKYLIKKTKLNKLLSDFRGKKPVNLRKLYSVAISVGNLLTKFDEIDSIDINPLIASDDQVIAVDCRIILKKV